MVDLEPEPVISYNPTRPQVEGHLLIHQPRHKTFSLQLVLPAECSEAGAWQNQHQRDQRHFIQQLVGADTVSQSNIRLSSESCEAGMEGLEEPEGSGTARKHGQQNHLTGVLGN